MDAAEKFQKEVVYTNSAYWAVLHRKIKSSVRNDELSSYSFSGYEYLIDVHMDPHKRKTMIKGAQIGATESALNMTFHAIDVQKKDVLYVLPDDRAAGDFSAGRFDPSIESSPRLQQLFTEVSNVGHKRAGLSNLYVRGAGAGGGTKKSRNKLKSVPVSVLIMDEFDEIPREKVPLAEERVSAKQEFLIFKLSTPSIPNYGIDAEYKKSSMGVYLLTCPRCGHHQNLTLGSLDWDGTDENTAVLKCKKCKVPFSHAEKLDMIKSGFWYHQYPDSDHRGYWIPQFYSPVQDAVRICKKLKEAQTDKAAEQEFYNSALGMGHIMEGSQLTKMDVEMCKTDQAMLNSITGVQTTAGIDVGAWLHIEVAAWQGKRKQVLWVGKVKEFEEAENILKQFRVKMCVVDMLPETRKAREFSKKFPGRVYLCRYGQCRDIIGIDEKLFHVVAGRTETLDITLDRFRSAGELVSIPKNTPEEFVDHMCAPVRVYEKSQGINVPIYRETGPDHFCHSSNYNEIAHMIFTKSGGGFISDDLQTALENNRQSRDTAPNKMVW